MPFRRRYREALPPEERTTVIREEGVVPPPGPPGPPPDPEREWWQWLLVALVIVAIIAGLAAYFATRGGGEKKVVVPKVIGLPQSTAESRLHDLGLKTEAGQEFNSRPNGTVFAQAPGAGTQAGKGDLVKLKVSKGPHAVSVPNTVSLTEADAVAQLTNAGLKADVVQVPSSAKAGTVVAQNPVAGTSLDAGSTVRLNVSKGRTQTTTVTTTTATTATATTATTATTTTSSTTTATTTTTRTTTTTASATVPDVTGSTLSGAVAQMRIARLLADSYPVASDQSGGTVVAQKPAAGGTAAAGSIVRLNVSTGTNRPSLPVPDVTGSTEPTARRALSKLFTVRTVYRAGRAGVVVGQLPTGGAHAKRWAQVIMYVGR